MSNIQVYGPFKRGQRVELHPATDLWMRGARFGTVEKIGRKWIHVNVDLLGRTVRISYRNLMPA